MISVKRWSAVVLACVFLFSAAHAQQADSLIPGEVVAQALFTYVGTSDLKDPEVPGQKGEVSLYEISIYAPFPLYENETWQWFAGPFYEMYRFTFDGIDGLDDFTLYSAALSAGAVYTGFDQWELAASITPGFFTDFRKTNSDDFKTLFHGMATWRLSDSVSFVGGVAYDSAFGEDELYPVGGVRWDPTPTLSLQLVLPEPTIIWAPTDGFIAHAHLVPAGGKWNVRDTEHDSREYDFKEESWRAGVGAEMRLGGSLWLHLSGGMDFNREYKIENNDEDYLLKSSVDDTWYVRAGLVIR